MNMRCGVQNRWCYSPNSWSGPSQKQGVVHSGEPAWLNGRNPQFLQVFDSGWMSNPA
jgi:hypothetical protein